MSDLVSLARDLAHRAHTRQVDKAGRPYIEHVARVAAAVADDPEAEAVAWLHDVLEDCPAFADEFWDSFPGHILHAVERLTRIPHHRQRDYYARIRVNPLALSVKLADIADNAAEERLALLPKDVADRLRRKYARARKALGAKGSPT